MPGQSAAAKSRRRTRSRSPSPADEMLAAVYQVLQRSGAPLTLDELQKRILAEGWKTSDHEEMRSLLTQVLTDHRDLFESLTQGWAMRAWGIPDAQEHPLDVHGLLESALRERRPRSFRSLLNEVARRASRDPDAIAGIVMDTLTERDAFVNVAPGMYDLVAEAGHVEPDLKFLAADEEPAEDPLSTAMTAALQAADRPLSLAELSAELPGGLLQRPEDLRRVRRHATQDPDRFRLVGKDHVALQAWQGSAKLLLYGMGEQFLLAALLHETLLEEPKPQPTKALLVRLGNDPRWPASATKSLQTLERVLRAYPHVFRRHERRRAQGTDAAPTRRWSLRDEAATLKSVAPRRRRRRNVHPLGKDVPLDMPWPDPTIANETARLAEVALKHLQRPATLDELADLMQQQLGWRPSKNPKAMLRRALEAHKALFRGEYRLL